MSEISIALNNTEDAQKYAVRLTLDQTLQSLNQAVQAISAQYANEWQAQALSSDHQHILSSFGDADSSWALTYNLFADRLLQTNLVSQDVS